MAIENSIFIWGVPSAMFDYRSDPNWSPFLKNGSPKILGETGETHRLTAKTRFNQQMVISIVELDLMYCTNIFKTNDFFMVVLIV